MQEPVDWRKDVIRPALVLNVGGFCPTGELTKSCFGEVRAGLPGELWPTFNNRPLWPLCQLNLLDACFCPEALSDIALITLFIAKDYMGSTDSVIDSSASNPNSSWFLRSYKTLEGLQPVTGPDHASPLRPYECEWSEAVVEDYPTHDTIPIDFDALDIGEYYDQKGVHTANGTKLLGWPDCIQSEPWWECKPEGKDFDYLFQVDSEEKSGWYWGDGGAGYFARDRNNPNRWALDYQFY
ncbi:DUF1963 domain-containing protein [Profundibacter sp.]